MQLCLGCWIYYVDISDHFKFIILLLNIINQHPVCVWCSCRYETWNFGIFKKIGVKGPRPWPMFGTMMPLLRKVVNYLDSKQLSGLLVFEILYLSCKMFT
jgi:hypothetical protein